MASNNEVIEEIEALEAIMMDEVNVHYNINGQPNAVEITVKPATAQNIEEQHVRVTLIVTLPVGYPDECPVINLRNPRGIDDNVLELIKSESFKKCEEYLGFPVIYELIELVREKLTANNTPSCPCAICLFYFTDLDHFTKTLCFHYFHSNCLGRYILNCEETAAAEEKENQQPLWMTREKRQLLCPVCREPLKEEMSGTHLVAHPPPEEGKLLKDFNPEAPEIRTLQETMRSLYLHQKSKGGIIDLEEEKNKFLISSAVNNIDPPENEGLLVACVEESSLLSKKEVPSKQKANKRPSQINSQRGGFTPVPRKEFSNHFGGGGSRSRNAKRGNRFFSRGRQNSNLPTSECSKPADSSHVRFDKEDSKRKQNERSAPSKPTKTPDPERTSDCKQGPVTNHRLDDSKRKSERTHFNKNFHPRGGGTNNGRGSSKGIPPPGISELERNARAQPTS